MRSSAKHAAVALAAATTFALVAAPAQAQGKNDVVKRGDCTGSTNWKLKVGPDDGRLEVEGEIDSNRNGQTWRWRIRHDGAIVRHGVRRTHGPSGSFSVNRKIGNGAGQDTVVFRARNPRSGEVCRGVIRL